MWLAVRCRMYAVGACVCVCSVCRWSHNCLQEFWSCSSSWDFLETGYGIHGSMFEVFGQHQLFVLIYFILYDICLYVIQTVMSNTTKYLIRWHLQETFVRRSLFSSFGSYRDAVLLRQEIGRTYGLACRCPHTHS